VRGIEFNVAIDRREQMIKNTIFVAVVLLIPSYAIAGWFGPSTYEECVLKNMKGVTSDQASRIIAKACRDKFPEEIITLEDLFPMRDLTDDEITKITGSLACYQGYLSGSLHNGNNNISIVSVNIYFDGREYDSYINISPLSTSDVKLKIVGGKNNDPAWSILKAQGR
jgi:hypothetical protein